jgi:hypothetical protein
MAGPSNLNSGGAKLSVPMFVFKALSVSSLPALGGSTSTGLGRWQGGGLLRATVALLYVGQ